MNVHRRRFLTLGATLGLSAVAGARAALPASASIADGAATQTMYLTGTDTDSTVPWDFLCTAGRRSGAWGTLPTPSQWEFSGYGTYNYGGALTPGESGKYRHSFTPPASWAGRQVFLVFEGAMTDTTVTLNGKSAGSKHQGAFYRFRYDVTALILPGKSNLLEVTVDKDSSNTSVNQAERQGDYWNFGGIFRPVYLQAFPAARVDRVAIKAESNGAFAVDAYLGGNVASGRVAVQIKTLDGTNVGGSFSTAVSAGTSRVTVSTSVSNPKQWTAETPNLYQAEVVLTNSSGAQVHGLTERFGFRTVQVRAGDGLYVNGTKVVLKGVTRHTFYPTLGRASSPRLAREDIALMKAMNVNAVRMSHYPPDTYFLDLCDELGLYVLDELGGWQHSYDTAAGTPLVQAMVTRDVNHPSILFWDNGNEGGWNTALDGLFGSWDPQKRTVLHPWSNFGNIDTNHYPTYSAVQSKLAGSTVFMPTELLHGLYDGGAGAGLDDYWKLMATAPHSAGGFIWSLIDESIRRDDGGGAIDTNGNRGPDGIVGPFREKEGSFYTIKDIWSPVQLSSPSYYESSFPSSFDATVGLTNRYAFTNLSSCRFSWQLINYATPGGAGHTVKAQGSSASPNIAPGGSGKLILGLPGNWADSDALRVSVADASGAEITAWVWTIKKAADHMRRIVVAVPGAPSVTASQSTDTVTMNAGTTSVRIARASGRLTSISRNGTAVSLANGPAPAAGSSTLTGLTHAQDGAAHTVTATYSGNLQTVRWRLDSNGWLRLDYTYNLTGSHDYLGVNFDYPESKVTGVTWLGRGPYRVWKNRLRGVTTDVWTKAYNNTATGKTGFTYPEFKGYHANLYWGSLHTTEGTITIVSAQENVFLRLFTPSQPSDSGNAAAPFPGGNLSLLDGIPAIGNKFHAANAVGPAGQPNTANGTYARTVYFHFAS
ncbi:MULTISPECIES: glycoside hydrolase family 2 TIM barrel-domain containing protein [unclassified Streptomyces]|uniref:glycoside hydrolase family 2 TIM barrel-domain containing protein n=1 Tax=unclassified Streptomyces TaxID=2593676 RepID=UPI001FD437B5|nr:MULTISPECIES: glycoside hydrolase family 2 TIM barrel-domain containing protein [unclassified Streptomyces]MCZ4098728.1 glycoside hydrolase family 2 [Streptomyces sp. H39-C1]